MSFVCNENLRIAYDLSDEVIRNVRYLPDQPVETAEILDYVKKQYCPSIEMYACSFAKFAEETDPINESGAMMRIDFQGQAHTVSIVLNSDMSPTFQRFALVQQIGHLVTLPPDAQIDPDNYNVSTRISYDLMNVNAKDVENDYYLMREQVANVFALRVLMPSEQFYRKIRELGTVTAVAKFFKLTEDAVISRMMIGA